MFFILNYLLFSFFNGTPDRKETYTYEGDSTNVAKVAYDDNADGKTDRVALNTYDANGNLVKTEYHNDGVESNPENRVETNRYDANGNLVQKTIDANGDGQVDTIETYTVNDKGQRTGTSYADANGNVYKSETYTLDNNGNITEKRINEDGKATGDAQGVDRIEKYELNAKGETIKVSYDNNADGAVDKVEHIVVDANGHWVAKYVNADNDTSGTTGQAITLADGRKLTGVDKIETNTLNAKGQVVETLYDNNADKTADSRTEFVLDVNGNVVEEKRDLTNDDSIDKVTKYTVDAQGRQLSRTDYNQLADGSQVQTQREEYTLDENGNRTGMTRYPGESTTPTVIEKYQIDALGRSVVNAVDTNADGKTDQWYYNTYDANGNLVLQETDLKNEGRVTAKTLREYDALGRVIEQQIDNNNDGIYDSSVKQTYDTYGNLVKSEIDSNNDGAVNTINYATYYPNGLRATLWIDRTANGDTLDDSKYQYTYNDAGKLIAEIQTSNGNSSSYTYEYDELGRRSVSNQYSGDTLNATTTYEYWGGTDKVLKSLFSYSNGFSRSVEIEYNDALQIIHSYVDDRNNGSIEMLTFGDLNGGNTVAHSTNLTEWSQEKLAKLGSGLSVIRLSNASINSTLSIDDQTIAKISNGGLRIEGDATDTVNLAGFVKSTNTQVVNSHTYDVYTGSVNGENLNVLIDNDITTNIIG